MRIADANIAMASGRHYIQRGAQPTGTVFGQQQNLFADLTTRMKTAPENNNTSGAQTNGAANISGLQNLADANGQLSVRNSLLQELFRRMLQAGIFGGLTGAYNGTVTGIGGAGLFTGGMGMNSGMMTINQVSYHESEETHFSAKGVAMTEDGRELEFDVSLSMSRSFTSYTQINIPMFSNALFDPLMINVGTGVANISDQTFRFDLDMDGEEDDVALPGKGTAFLALDLNEDGIINDGSELFGVKSGDGFADLAVYDSDGNGWIDENDEIFEKLRVWYKNADGTDELVGLKAADIGAIYLGSQKTDFSLYGADMMMDGMIRATGLFLRESGGAGSVQHVDLAINRGESDGMIAEGVTVTDTDASPQGALVINTDDDITQSNTTNRTQDRSQDSAATRKAKEEARRKEAQERRMAEADRRKASLDRYQRRKQLRKEQLEALLSDREMTEEQLEQAAEEHQMREDAIEERYLEQHLSDGEALDAMAQETLMSVA